MGYGSYERLSDGRWGGYNIRATCDREGCEKVIDRGMAYLCGDGPEDDPGTWHCGNYFCTDHVHFGSTNDSRQICDVCGEYQEEALAHFGAELYDLMESFMDATGVDPQADLRLVREKARDLRMEILERANERRWTDDIPVTGRQLDDE